MNIACLGWGSLIWDLRDLPIRRQWFLDGPFGQVEFARKSKDGRVTLVLCQEAKPVRLLWAQMDATDLEVAKSALKAREQLTATNWQKDIGSWAVGGEEPVLISGLSSWAIANGNEAVIWTALRPKFDVERTPSEVEVLGHLRALRGAARDNAEQYVRRTPPQIDTEYRRGIEAELGWSYSGA